eukprot:Plantae.Rhodophyta-Rhodochaete_pulchella.ctg16001.p1 GENE.Plantae.Rhodophyta-Rhodochaete_pulchella.ctg16001~~Plantae.Rhodophyta-Rhodochaete_pulchella.ctg16001.p1  ORF type:complete len:426 (+),score=44.03 Plantae.Rhodophyta-Rhodochaete_pulchella.ctg16001:148-1278(+)
MLPRFQVGTLKTKPQDSDDSYASDQYLADVRQLRSELVRLRAFESSKLYYAYKVGTNVAIMLLAVSVIRRADTLFMGILGALILALFWQQCGWLAHDFLHHQVFQNRLYNNLFGLLVGNVFQGYSTSWWKNKHNHHHAVPNSVDSAGGGDPDIHTLPLLLWSEKLVEGEDLDKLPAFMVANQWLFYFPILCMARVSWLIQSAIYLSEPQHAFVGGNLWRTLEAACLAIHHVAVLWLMTQCGGLVRALVICAVAQAVGGLLIGIVFTVGHNAMPVLHEDECKNLDFFRLQVATTRDVTPSLFNDWFTGGLGYQVTHHLFPSLPRHSLPQATQLVKDFCAKHDIKYSCEGLVEGNAQVCRLLYVLSSIVSSRRSAQQG